VGRLARWLLGRPRAASEIADLMLDLQRLSIAGFGIDAPQGEVERRLGPADDYFARRSGRLLYVALGLRLTVGEGRRLETIEVIVRPQAGDACLPFAGRWLPWGTTTPPGEAELTALLGPPTLREADADEIALEWRRELSYIGADLSPDGALRVVYLSP
jgi:hypothetical protein